MIDPDNIWLDRQGNSISAEEWGVIHSTDKIVAQEQIGGCMISTVWLGINHNWGDGPPLIFETMVFPLKDSGKWNLEPLYMDRYATEEEARAGHATVVEMFKSAP
jgi:hypothetical protein